MTKAKKCFALALLSGGMMFQLGCLGGIFNQMLSGIPIYLASEFLLDNNNIFDLFPDGPGGAQ